MKRAFAVLEIRATGQKDGKRTFTGIATTPETDSYGDIVDPQGAEFKLPMPLLWQHDSRDPIGWVTAAKATKKGIEVECEVADIPDDGPLKARLESAWQYIKNKLVGGLSIGFYPIESARIEGTYGYHYTKWKWLELSTVTIGANEPSVITAVRSAALLSIKQAGTRSPALSGTKTAPVAGNRSKRAEMKTLQQLLEERATKAARCNELKELRTSESRRFNEDEATEFDELSTDLDDLEDEIRMKRFDDRMAASASAVSKGSAAEQRASRGPTILVRTQDPDDKFAGQSFIRHLKLKALSRLTHESVSALAEQRFGRTHPKFVQFVKAAVAGGGTGSGEWGAELAKLDALYTGDFITFLYGKTVFDQLPLREVPARVRVKGQDGAASASWVGESKAGPVHAQDYSSIDLTPLKVMAICVMSNELIEDSAPAADMLARDNIVEASAQKVDSTFFSTAAASAGVSPAGILNGVTAIQASGTAEADVRTDAQAVAYPFVTAKMASGLVWAINPAQGLSLGSFVNTFSMPSFPGINEEGGTFMGRKAYAGDNVTPGQLVLLRPQDIWKIGDGGVQVSMSDVATIEMNDAPAGASDTPVDMASHRVSMFQTESTAFKVVRRINFQKRRTGAVQYIDNAEYGGVTS